MPSSLLRLMGLVCKGLRAFAMNNLVWATVDSDEAVLGYLSTLCYNPDFAT